MLEPVRQYALEKLEQSEAIEEARRVHAEYFLTLAEEIEPQLIGPWEAEAFGRLEEELDNVRAALAWASEHGEAALGLRLGGALMSFWFGEGHYGEGRGWLENALAQEGPATALVRAKALGAASLLASEQSDHSRAKWAAEEGLELSKEAGIAHSREYFFPGGIPATFFLNLMATLAMNEGDFERARALGEEGLALGRQADAAHGIVWSLLILGIAATLRADYEQAERRYAEGISLGRGLASAYWRFLYLQNWGWTALLQGDPKRATVLLNEAVELARERRRGFMGLLSRPLDNLGWAALLGGDLGRASAQFGENLTLSKALGDNGTLLMSLEGLASAAGAKGNTIRAARLFGAAEALTEAIRYRLVPQERAVLEPYRSSVRSRLGKAAWDVALAQGRAMRLDEAIGYALSEE
jgi:tetratricopeptide (TPR) repeat protein